MHGRGGREPRRVVRLDLRLPDERAGRGVDGVEPARQVAEQQHVAARRAATASGAARTGPLALKRPLDATAVGSERLHEPARAADEDVAVDDGRRRERRDVARETVRPREREARDLLGA